MSVDLILFSLIVLFVLCFLSGTAFNFYYSYKAWKNRSDLGKQYYFLIFPGKEYYNEAGWHYRIRANKLFFISFSISIGILLLFYILAKLNS
jgi:hypothetical protein